MNRENKLTDVRTAMRLSSKTRSVYCRSVGKQHVLFIKFIETFRKDGAGDLGAKRELIFCRRQGKLRQYFQEASCRICTKGPESFVCPVPEIPFPEINTINKEEFKAHVPDRFSHHCAQNAGRGSGRLGQARPLPALTVPPATESGCESLCGPDRLSSKVTAKSTVLSRQEAASPASVDTRVP